MSHRGSHTLFSNIFEAPTQPVEKQRKGRSQTLISKRNECLVERYYYYGKFTLNRYSAILEALSVEFFISQVTIPEVIDANYDKLAELKRLQPSKQYFQKRWPHLVW